MKSFLTAEEAKEIREIAENLKNRGEEDKEKRYEDFLKSETGRAYKKHVEVFVVAPLYLSAKGAYIDDPALAKLYLEAIEKGVPLGINQEQSDSDYLSKIIELQFEIGGFHQGHDRLILKGNKISVIRWEHQETVVTHNPSAEEWKEFSQSLEQLKIWDWKQRYDSHILDGTQWSLLVRTARYLMVLSPYATSDDKPVPYSEINCYGSNSFPPDFSKLITSINKLINQDYFEEGYENSPRYDPGADTIYL